MDAQCMSPCGPVLSGVHICRKLFSGHLMEVSHTILEMGSRLENPAPCVAFAANSNYLKRELPRASLSNENRGGTT